MLGFRGFEFLLFGHSGFLFFSLLPIQIKNFVSLFKKAFSEPAESSSMYQFSLPSNPDLGVSKPRILNKSLIFHLLVHFIKRNRLKQTVFIFIVTQNSYCYKNTFNLLFLFLNWIQVGRDERKRLTNLLLQLVFLSLSYASSNSLWFFLKLLLLFLNLTTRHSLLFF